MGSNHFKFIKPTQTIKLDNDTNAIVQSPNGQLTAVGVGRHKIVVYHQDNFTSPLIELEGCTRSICSAGYITPEFSHDSKILAFRWNNLIRILDCETLKIIKEIDNRRKWSTISFSHDDRYIAVGHHSSSDRVKIYDLTKDSSKCFFGQFQARVVQLGYADRNQQYYYKVNPVWLPNSNHILTRWNNDVQIHQINEDGIQGIGILNHKYDITDISVSPNGNFVAIATKKSITIWGKIENIFMKIDTVVGCSDPGICSCYMNPHTAFSSDNKYFAVSNYKECLVYQTLDLKQVHKITLPETVRTMSFSPDGKNLGIGMRYGYQLYDLQSKTGLDLELCTSKFWQRIDALWSDNGNVLSGRWNKEVRSWHLKDLVMDGEVIEESTQEMNFGEIYEGESVKQPLISYS